ncbi:DEAD-box ATP-dependent RNA helicase 40,Putative ATP-dependent RNA helicase Pl10,DEAD-box ATP-dependent RNA helicase 52A,DEAD-box ATP-dependent RNA helicase 5,Putative DEAD-box RNA helicase HEL64,ATP-dependent RNA helicase DBP2 [Pyricularia oryzae 70-15],Pre-mRNA-processing ATP-dependent RNA helicase prp5,ATP-dependent RNA helicase dbp2,ATP-dependent RNA helicase DBP3,Probable ATP-dependent RNA helicase DDX17,DEAD-box ATP-dependent RNA helicase 14,ATP-dependent RNA helicase p62,ATP-dependent RNA helicase DB|uniref:RNA helicase n=1 Tax=Mytilus coruscus TaxID=42192 RepID=A0A6J8D0A3_MYTCO|nr:DEAD-box ATP-dependent RNA helicase 40,Putative ATP-dependent RNA helicase Pl10,DEAD-box ATP-dependent RNA helicase 52A,DEAD-box ATP-dependent RNA helicase 5,Putative DEAD-box RNA helicase HEL64,ATP-dependent RNA helicase DBP2 [Pyricularia oryzae 70-15],Pre-mRNA-processing ATP-dependent RNA helicase prp5,ATP-dependent RNA helicase dbp2,ATP-dependent RNA helicase DBP3,Probable ATP-dependent RNA helicase DDX17,DEAD-box ATP-dependent RNA helicase 14,ATP-dependent RNA helicase p62,ATP-dependent RNA 
MFARGGVCKLVGTLNQISTSCIVIRYQRNAARNILRNCSVSTKFADVDEDNDNTVNRLSETKNSSDSGIAGKLKQLKIEKVTSDSTNEDYFSRNKSDFVNRYSSNDFEDELNKDDDMKFNRNRSENWDDNWEDEDSFKSSRPFNRGSQFNKSRGGDFQRNFNNSFQNRYEDRGFQRGRFSNDYGRDNFAFKKREQRKPEYKEFQKDFYKENESVHIRSNEEVKAFYEKHQITLSNTDLRPLETFEEAGFPDIINRKLQEEAFTSPTAIQSVTWPLALSGKDVIGIAQTGSGKTLGFMLPAFVHIQNQEKLQRGDGPICLVLVPTRELCQQVQEVADRFGYPMRMKSAAIYGGANRYPQLQKLSRGAEVCIATPGRLNDFLSSGETNLDRCTCLVLDEADRMLDMGFEPQIRQIIEQIRPDRQTLMWSATWPEEVQELANDYLHDHVKINVGSVDLIANKNIKQEVVICNSHEKPQELGKILQQIIQSPKDEKVLIFAQTKVMCERISQEIRRNGIHNVCIHGDKSQRQRDHCLEVFRNGRVKIMVATDVCARGLDVSDITYVVNYDFPPKGVEDYIHRIGRTGRAGNSGTAVTLFSYDDRNSARDLIKIMKEADQEVPEELFGMTRHSHGNQRRNSRYQPSYRRDYQDRRPFRHRMNRGEGYASGFTRMDD